VGEGKGAEEEDCLEPTEPAARTPDTIPQAMKATLEDVLSLLSKYAVERTPVRAVLGTASVSVARVIGTIRVSIVGGVPQLICDGCEQPFFASWSEDRRRNSGYGGSLPPD